MKAEITKYQKELAKHRAEAKSIREDFAKERAAKIAFSSRMIDDIVDKYGGREELICYNDLKLFKVGERINLNDSVEIEKTYEDETKMTFLTYTLEGGTLSIHSHDCLEIVKVIKGVLFEKTRGYKEYLEGSEIAYAKNEKHEPYATRNSIWEVTFYKDGITRN